MAPPFLYGLLWLAPLLCGPVVANGLAARDAPAPAPAPVAQVTIGSDTYTYASLVGHGFWSASAQDFVGDTAGGWGSAIAADVSTWHMDSDGSYKGVFYTLPDRGWNTEGIGFCSRLADCRDCRLSSADSQVHGPLPTVLRRRPCRGSAINLAVRRQSSP